MSDLRPPWTTACQSYPSFNSSQSLLNLMSIELVILCNHLILCRPLLILPSTFPRVFPYESVGSSHQVAKIMSHEIYKIHMTEFEDDFLCVCVREGYFSNIWLLIYPIQIWNFTVIHIQTEVSFILYPRYCKIILLFI